MNLRWFCLVSFAALMLCPAVVAAQDAVADLRDTVDETTDAQAEKPILPLPRFEDTQTPARVARARKAGDDLGLRRGGMILYPSVETGIVASTNGAMSAGQGHEDVALRAVPGLRVLSDWPRHELDASAKAAYQKSVKTGDLTAVSVGSKAHFRLDIRRSTRADLDVSYDLTEANDPNRDLATGAVKPRRDQTGQAQIGLRHDFGHWFGEVAAGANVLYASNVKLRNGTTENNADRAFVQPKVRLRAGLGTGAAWRPFAEASYEPRLYVKKKDRNGLRRDSHGYGALLGFEFDDSDIWTGSIAAAYVLRDYTAAGLDTEHALGLEAHGSWRPTRDTTLDLNSTVGLKESFAKGSTAVRVWTVDLALSHALTDRLKLSAGTGLTIDDAKSGSDATYSARLGAEWQLNPFFALSGEVGSTWFDAGKAADSFDEQRASVSAVVRR